MQLMQQQLMTLGCQQGECLLLISSLTLQQRRALGSIIAISAASVREMQQLVQAALHAPAPAAPAAARSHPQLLVVQHEGSRVGTPTAEAAAAAAAEASGYDSPGAGGAAAGQGEGFSVPVAVRIAAPVPERAPVGPKLVFYGKPACHLVREHSGMAAYRKIARLRGGLPAADKQL